LDTHDLIDKLVMF